MKQVSRSVLLWYTPQEMFDLVTGVPDYPRFLPWCARGEIVEQRPDGVTARLHMAFAGVKHSFTTRNTHVPGQSVVITMVDGPFSQLDGHWKFLPIIKSDGTVVRACKVEFDMRYTFASRALEAVVSPVFDKVAATLVDSFVQRAEQVHGKR
jgi:ribosome-associated toxin RatA of RatAB toxin-antitoxin module